MGEPLVLVGGRVCTPEGLQETPVVVVGDRIAGVGPAELPAIARRIDLQGAIVAPGLIDTHVHGGLSDDAMDATPAALAAIGRHLAAHGVTGWLPTTVACPAEQLDPILACVARAMADPAPPGAVVLGAHLESNFLAPRYKGAQPETALRAPDDGPLRAVIERHRATIRVLTLAPELPGAIALIHQLVAWGIVVAVGHSDATYDQVLAAVEAGARRVTHLCNAQRPFHHREPGVVGAGLVVDALASEVIADLVHVHPAGLQIAARCKPPGQLMLVSDALRGTGLPAGTYELGGQTTTLDGRIARLADGTIAGSTITLDRAVANMVEHAGVGLVEAFAMASSAPARSLGLADRGAIAPGLRADLAIFSDDFGCLGTLVGGQWVHGAIGQEARLP